MSQDQTGKNNSFTILSQSNQNTASLLCPSCGSEKIVLADNGLAICLSCAHTFSPSKSLKEPASKETGKTEHPLRLFLSYGHTESEIAEKIFEALRQRGHEVWFDQNDIKQGQDWRDRITAGLEKTDEIISCLSRHSVRNPGVCLNELSIAIGIKGAAIKTILLEKEEDLILPASLSHIQWLDMSGWKEELAKGEDSFSSWFDQKMSELFESLESRENIEFSGQLKKLEEKLVPIKSFPRQESLLKIPFTGREWLAKKIEDWAQNASIKDKIAMVFGDPGVGKSSFAVHFAHYNPLVAAAIFCDFSQESLNDPDVLIRTLAYQLAGRLPSYRRLLLSTLENRDDLLSLHEGELFHLLLSWPLSHSIDGEHEVQLIVIDGLDESARGEVNPLARVMQNLASSLPRWIKIVATSRKESAVLACLDSSIHIDLERDSDENREDILVYLKNTLAEKAREEGLGQEEFEKALEKLYENSQGIFLYASLMARAILDPAVSESENGPSLKNFNSFPKGLSEAFQSWFSWYFPDPQDYKNRFQKPLGLIAAGLEPIPIEEMEIMLDLDEDDLHYFRRRLNPLLVESENMDGKKVLSFSHQYLQEWITSEQAYFFQASKKAARKTMLEKFLSILKDPDDELSAYEIRMIYPLADEFASPAQINQILFDESLTTALQNQIASLSKRNQRLQAISLCNQAIELFERAFEKAKEEKQDTLLLQHALAKLIEIKARVNKEIKNLPEAIVFYEKAIKLAETYPNAYQDPDSRRFLSRLYNDMALAYQERNEIESALAYYQKALDTRRSLIKEFKEPEDQKELAIYLTNIGSLYNRQNESPTALQFNLKSLEILENLEKTGQDFDLSFTLAQAHNNLAALYLDLHEQSMAIDHFEQALEILSQIQKEKSTEELLNLKAITLNNMAALYSRRHEAKKARDYNEKALAIREEMAENSDLPEIWQYLADSYNQQSLIFKELNQVDASLASLQKSTGIWSRLAQKYDLPDYDLSLANSYANLAVLYRFKQDYNQAYALHQKALEIRRKLYNQYDLPVYGEHLAKGLDNLAFFFSEREDFIQAVAFQKEAISLWQNLLKDSHSGQPDYLHKLGQSFAFLAFLYSNSGKKREALDYELKSLACFERLCKKDKHKEKDFLYSLAQENLSLGVSLFELGDYKRSLQFLNKNTKLLSSLIRQKEIRAVELLKASYDEMVNDCLAQGNGKKGQRYEKETRKLARLLAELKK